MVVLFNRSVMSWRVRRFLKEISDRKWYTRASKGIGAGTVQFCIEHGFIKTKKINRKRKGDLESYEIAFKITLRGERAFNLHKATSALKPLAKAYVS